MAQKNRSVEEWTALVVEILTAHRTAPSNAQSVAQALIAAEMEGQKGHGLSRVLAYAKQAQSGKVQGAAHPKLAKVAPAVLRIDACHGFAYPAFDLAIEALPPLAKKTGIALAGIAHSHHCGMLGYQAERLAHAGVLGIVLSNSPKAMAPWGGNKALFGTNPIAFACPRQKSPPLVIDLSLSKVPRGKIKLAAEKQEPIPKDWALDAQGQPTTDATAALAGTMLPIGEAKGTALVLMVELLTAALTASHFGYEATSFFEPKGDPPSIGQFLLAIDPMPLSEAQFESRLETLIEAILLQPGTRIPGANKPHLRAQAQKEGISIDEALYQSLMQLARK